jgi:hypothetical protein
MFDKMSKVRLIEEDISYEDLAVIENFSDDEITFELKRQLNKDKYIKIALQDYKKVEERSLEL